jgi:hypothetical protein
MSEVLCIIIVGATMTLCMAVALATSLYYHTHNDLY